MGKLHRNRLLVPVAVVLLGFALWKIFMDSNEVSTDLNALNALVTLDFSAKTGQWEVFGTPEYTGGVPAPTDYMTLIAEFRGATAPSFKTLPNSSDRVWIAPEAPRQWQSPRFKAIFSSAKRHVVTLADHEGCHPYTAKMTKSGRVVSGFTCQKEGEILVYLTLQEPSGP